MVGRWIRDPQYSHGFLVPLMAAFVLWNRRERLVSGKCQADWRGLMLVALACLVRLGGAYVHFPWLDAWSLLPCLTGICLLAGGLPALRWAWPALALLVFLMPVPHQVEQNLTFPLTRLAALASVYTLQMLGYPALGEGNLILLGELKIGVLDACSGLGMLFTFLALSSTIALVIERPFGDRIFLFVSAVPIAVLLNVTRCTATAVLHVLAGSALANAVFHDLAGWLMMPLALAVLWLELKMLDRLFQEAVLSGPLPINLSGTVGGAPVVAAESAPRGRPGSQAINAPAPSRAALQAALPPQRDVP